MVIKVIKNKMELIKRKGVYMPYPMKQKEIKKMKINTNKLCDLEFENIDSSDYPDFCDAYLSYAWHLDDDRELTDEELEWVNDNESSWVYERVLDHAF